MRYVNKGPLFIDVHMHKPTVAARTYMDSLLAFWPGIQVLKGDLKAAIEFHETLYQVIKVNFPTALDHEKTFFNFSNIFLIFIWNGCLL